MYYGELENSQWGTTSLLILGLCWALFTLCRMAFAPARKPYRIGLLFTHKNRDFGAISVTERSCAAQISKVETHIFDR